MLRKPTEHWPRSRPGAATTTSGIETVIGRRLAQPRQQVGFGSPLPADCDDGSILLPEEAHAMTIAPTGAGKSISSAVPVLLQHQGPAIVLDIRGELAAITARRRRQMGQRVVIVDPEGITGERPSGFNPLDLVDPETVGAFNDARSIAEVMLPPRHADKDVFWRKRGMYYLAASILGVVTQQPPAKRNLVTVRDDMHRMCADVATRGEGQPPPWAQTAEKDKKSPGADHPALRRAESILGMGSTDTVGGMLHTAMEGIGFIEGCGIEESLSSSGFTFDEITEGAPLTIYLVLPPHLLEACDVLLRLWFGTIFTALMRRRSRPALSTLLLIDEAAQLGPFSPLRQAVTLLRGYGVQTWTFWQDVAQLEQIYPEDWPSLVNNCRVLQAFGARNAAGRKQLAEAIGADIHLVDKAGASDMVLGVDGFFQVAGRLDYRHDPEFADLFDPNPIYAPSDGPHGRPRRAIPKDASGSAPQYADAIRSVYESLSRLHR